MTIPLETRDLARRLLSNEARSGKTSDSKEAATLHVYEKLRESICGVAGTAGFQPLAQRALALARAEAPGLGGLRVSRDGSLEVLEGLEAPIGIDKIDKEGAANHGAVEGGVTLIARMLGLLQTFLGEALTLSLLRNVWPAEAFDDHNAGNGRNA